MNQLKTRLQALSLLDRALGAMTDAELEAAVETIPDDHRESLDQICGARDGGFTDPAARTLAIRATAARSRLNGGLESISTVLCDVCLAECIELLGDHSDSPTEEQLLEVTPKLIETHGLAMVRLMMAGSIAGEAASTDMLSRLLKHDETLGLPPEEREEVALLPAPQADADVKAKRKALKEQRQAAARASREQQLRARHRV